MKKDTTKYTAFNDKEVEKQIDNQIKTLTGLLLRHLDKKNIYSILLIGGFAREEGSIKIVKGKVQPLNDFDLFVVSYAPIDEEILNNISLDFNRQMNFDSEFSFSESSPLMNFYSDIRNITVNKLRDVDPFIKYYEIKHSARVLYGRDARKLIPNFDISDIPLQDGLRFLFNRASLLIECFRFEYLERKLTLAERQALLFYSSKMYLSIAEALLLLSGKFVSSYKERASIFSRTYKQDFKQLSRKIPDLDKKLIKFTDFKLKPNLRKTASSDMRVINYWFRAKEDAIITILYYLRRAFSLDYSTDSEFFLNRFTEDFQFVFLKPYIQFKLKKKIGLNLNDDFLLRPYVYIARHYLNFIYFKELIKLNKRHIKILSSSYDPWLKLFCTIPILLNSVEKKGIIKSAYLDLAVNKIDSLYPKPAMPKSNKKKLDVCYRYYANAFRLLQFIKV